MPRTGCCSTAKRKGAAGQSWYESTLVFQPGRCPRPPVGRWSLKASLWCELSCSPTAGVQPHATNPPFLFLPLHSTLHGTRGLQRATWGHLYLPGPTKVHQQPMVPLKSSGLPWGQGSSQKIRLQNRSHSFSCAQQEKVKEMKAAAIIKVSWVWEG